MKATRRGALALLAASASACGTALATAQQRAPRIGYLVHSPLIDPPSRERAAFLDELRKLGYSIGTTLHVEYRSAENEPEFFPQLVAELLALDVDLIVAAGDPAALAAKAATSRVPIVFTQSPDPVGSGLVRSLARPGGNVTGLSFVAPDLAGKRLQLLHEALPDVRRVALMWDASTASTHSEVQASVEAAARLGLGLERRGTRDAGQLARHLQAMRQAARTHCSCWPTCAWWRIGTSSSNGRSAIACPRPRAGATSCAPAVC